MQKEISHIYNTYKGCFKSNVRYFHRNYNKYRNTLIQLGGRKFAATTTFFQSSPLVLHFRQRWTRIFFILWVDSATDREARTLSCTSLWPPVKRFNPPQFFAYGGIHWHTTASYILCHTSFCQTVYQLLSVTRKKKAGVVGGKVQALPACHQYPDPDIVTIRAIPLINFIYN